MRRRIANWKRKESSLCTTKLKRSFRWYFIHCKMEIYTKIGFEEEEERRNDLDILSWWTVSKITISSHRRNLYTQKAEKLTFSCLCPAGIPEKTVPSIHSSMHPSDQGKSHQIKNEKKKWKKPGNQAMEFSTAKFASETTKAV